MFEEGRVIVDEMLHDVAVFLRIFGVSGVEYMHGLSDDEILSLLKKNDVLITRDRELYLRAKRKAKAVLVPSDLVKALVEVFKALRKRPNLESRCAVCGGELEEIEKDRVRGEVPEKVFKSQGRFWKCKRCGKIYWRGGHWRNILKVYEAVSSALGRGET